jgi:hypothetical protein
VNWHWSTQLSCPVSTACAALPLIPVGERRWQFGIGSWVEDVTGDLRYEEPNVGCYLDLRDGASQRARSSVAPAV